MDAATLAGYLVESGIPEHLAQEFTRGFDRHADGRIDVREFQLGLLAMVPAKSVTEKVPLADVPVETIEEVYEDLSLQLGLPPYHTMTDRAIRTILISAINRGDIEPFKQTTAQDLQADEHWLATRASMLFRIYDTNNDGQLTFEELVTMVSHLQSGAGHPPDQAAAHAQAREIRGHIGTGMVNRPINLETFKEAIQAGGALAELAQQFSLAGARCSWVH